MTDQELSDPLLGRPVLEALGLSTREILAAAADRFCGSVDMERLVGTFAEEGDGRVSRVMEGVFHADGGQDGDKDDKTQGEWCDIGNETKEEWEDSLRKSVAQAKKNGMTAGGLLSLEELLRKHRDIVRVRYNGGTAARVRPLELRITDGAHSVRAKPRRYPPRKTTILTTVRVAIGKIRSHKKGCPHRLGVGPSRGTEKATSAISADGGLSSSQRGHGEKYVAHASY